MTDYRSILQQYWHYDDFRPLQLDIIKSVGSGRDTLALLPTGGGKSICFQVPAMAMAAPGYQQDPDSLQTYPDGLCLVITPLVALMKDQVQHLQEKGIKAFCLYAGQTAREVAEILDNCQFGHTKFLYISPERLESEQFRTRLKFLPVAMIAVDEAHCISQWGYDFRPPYLRIGAIRQYLIDSAPVEDKENKRLIPILALTATATPEVVEDIQERLGFREKNVFRASFVRTNLSYVVRHTEDKPQQLLQILQGVPGTSVVYVRNRMKTKETSDYLNAQGIAADYFHAGLSNAEKDARQQAWMQGQTRVMVATNAFGMGIDKADVRTVIHLDLPDTIEAYFQEAGRAGRDGKTAYAVLLFGREDRQKVQKRITDNFPERVFLKRVYEAVGDWLEVALGFGAGQSYAFSLEQFCRDKHLPLLPTYSAIGLLAQAGYWTWSDEHETPPRVKIRCSKEQLYHEDISPIQEDVLSLLMRQYTGLFTDFAILRTDNLCKTLEMQPKQLTEVLIQLAQQGIISYIPRRISPYLTWTKDRQPLEYIQLSEQQYEEKQNRYISKISAMLEYAEQDRFCRQQALVAYFGETTTEPCGTCDVCRIEKSSTH